MFPLLSAFRDSQRLQIQSLAVLSANSERHRFDEAEIMNKIKNDAMSLPNILCVPPPPPYTHTHTHTPRCETLDKLLNLPEPAYLTLFS